MYKYMRTNDKVDLRTKVKSEIFVAHELVHFYGFDDSMFCNTLEDIVRWVRLPGSTESLLPALCASLRCGHG